MRTMGDILTSSLGELIIIGGDISVGDATIEHTRDILVSHKGEYKQYPTLGVGIQDFLNDDGVEDMIRTVRQELVKDGQTVNSLKYINGQLIINSEYA